VFQKNLETQNKKHPQFSESQNLLLGAFQKGKDLWFWVLENFPKNFSQFS
jgi:hypothetical protein